ncbi:MAG: polysaccharide biosynthesis tyrosine autokinase [Desulfobacterales bacterium]|nr:MAG: polysaccharide biosynthesis tyrosine autokinase [Desulfobacterales bacterium]
MDEYIEKKIDLRDYLRVLIKRRWIIMTIFALVVLFVAVNTFTAVLIYKGTSRILIEKERPNLLSIQDVSYGWTDPEFYETQYKIIESRAVARNVIQRLDLENSLEFFPEPQDNIVSNIKGWIRETLQGVKGWIKSIIKTEETKTKGVEQATDHDAPDSGLVSAFIGRIEVSPVQESWLVDVSVSARDPVMAARMTNELVRAYIDQNLETKLMAAKDAVEWLNERIDEEREKVEVAEKALLRYKEKHQIITGFSSDAENITAQKLAELNNQVVEAESHRVEAETRYRQAISLKGTPDMLDSIPEVLSNDLVNEIKKIEVTLFNRMSELSKKYGRKHPKMVAIASELKELKKRKAVEAKRVVNSLKNEYKLALAREESLKQALAQQKDESLNLNKKAVQFGVLQREAESSRHMYELLIKRFKETSLIEEMKTGNIRVIDKAEVPQAPVGPNKNRNLMLAVVLGLTLGMGLAFFLEYLDNTIKLPDEIKEQLKIPFLGPVPIFSPDGIPMNGHKDLVTIHDPKSTASEAYRSIRTGILYSSVDTAPQVIMMTSSGPLEGKTVSSSNMAVVMAKSESKVLLMDCDMRRPRVHKLFSIDREIGLSSILAGTSNIKGAIVPSPVKGLDILPVGPIPPNPSEILGSKRMRQFINALRKKYARIIIDSPPVSSITDAAVLARMVDSVMLVIRAGETPRPVIEYSLEQLKTVNANIMGAILNAVSVGWDSYYYYHYYYDYYGKDRERRKRNLRKG